MGFDIGGTKCSVVLGEAVPAGQGSASGATIRITTKRVLPTDRAVFEMIELIYSTAEKMLVEKGVAAGDIRAIGISCGGPLNSKRGLILSPPNLPGWDNIPLVEMTEKRFGVPVTLQNDANACAVAEWRYGAGRGFNHLIFLTFGTGMGAGLILNGQLYSGTTDLAGEVGHIRLSDNGPAGFGKEGSFEGWCSGGGIAQSAQVGARKNLQMGRPVSFCDSMSGLPALTAKIVAEAALQGDEIALEVFRQTGRYLGRGLSLLIDILNPELIIIGSIYARAKILLEPEMNAMIEQEAIGDARRGCRIVPSALGESLGDMAALSLASL